MPKRLPDDKIEAALKELRGDLTLAEFAERVGKKATWGPQFGRYERGEKRPSTDTLRSVAHAFGVPESVFFEGPEQAGVPLTALEVARLRDQVVGAATELGKVLAVLNGALGLSSPREDSLQLLEHGEETLGVIDQDLRRKAGGGRERPRPQGGSLADERYKDDPSPD